MFSIIIYFKRNIFVVKLLLIHNLDFNINNYIFKIYIYN